MAGLVLKVSAGGIPVGAYSAKFAGVEPTPADPTRNFGPGLKWSWEVVGGPHAGAKAFRTTTPSPTPKNACGRILSGLMGRSLQIDEQLPIDDLIGRVYLIVVQEGKEGGTRVETVTALPTTTPGTAEAQS